MLFLVRADFDDMQFLGRVDRVGGDRAVRQLGRCGVNRPAARNPQELATQAANREYQRGGRGHPPAWRR